MYFVYPVYIQQKKVTDRDLHISTSGLIQRTYDPLNLHIENIDVDFYRNSDGFDMIMQWNYPEAALDTDMYAKNTTFYAS